MVRLEPDLSNENCYNCGHSTINLDELYAERSGRQGNEHIEIYSCPICNTEGAVEYIPPTSRYKLKGMLFGEKEDVTEIRERGENLR